MTLPERDAAEEALWDACGRDERLDGAVVPEGDLDGRDAVSLRFGARLLDGEDLAASVALPAREEWTDLCDAGALALVATNRPRPLALPLAPLDAADPFLGYVCRTTVRGDGAIVPSTKDALNRCGRIATAFVARASGRFVGDRPQAIAAYASDVGDAWAPFLAELQDLVRTRWTYLVPDGAEDRARLRSLCERALAFERRFAEAVAAGPRGPRTERAFRRLVASANP